MKLFPEMFTSPGQAGQSEGLLLPGLNVTATQEKYNFAQPCSEVLKKLMVTNKFIIRLDTDFHYGYCSQCLFSLFCFTKF